MFFKAAVTEYDATGYVKIACRLTFSKDDMRELCAHHMVETSLHNTTAETSKGFMIMSFPLVFLVGISFVIYYFHQVMFPGLFHFN